MKSNYATLGTQFKLPSATAPLRMSFSCLRQVIRLHSYLVCFCIGCKLAPNFRYSGTHKSYPLYGLVLIVYYIKHQIWNDSPCVIQLYYCVLRFSDTCRQTWPQNLLSAIISTSFSNRPTAYMLQLFTAGYVLIPAKIRWRLKCGEGKP